MSKAADEIYTKAVEELGIVLVAASGNDNSNTKYFPASHPSVISVGALGSSGKRYFSSNFNDQVEFVGPGEDIVSTTVSPNALQTGNFAYAANTVLGTARTFVTGNLVPCDMSQVVYHEKCEEVEELQNGICMFAMTSPIDGKGDSAEMSIRDLVKVCADSGGIGAVVYDESLGDRPIPNIYAYGSSHIPAISISKSSAYQILESMEMEGESDHLQVSIGDAQSDRLEYTFAMLSGTSMAAPHVTGSFALLKSHFPQCSQWQIRLALAETAKNPDGNGDCNEEYGYGLVQVKDAYDWLQNRGDCQDWIPDQVSAGGCSTQAFTFSNPSPTDLPSQELTNAPTNAPTMVPTIDSTSKPTSKPSPEPNPVDTLTPSDPFTSNTTQTPMPPPVVVSQAPTSKIDSILRWSNSTLNASSIMSAWNNV
jgi:serine protease